jgi:hypothetical protein
MNKFFLIILSVILFGACTVASPLTTTKNWLEAMKSNNYDEALSYMELENKDSFLAEFKENYGKVAEYEIQNAIPLSSGEIEKLGVTEANTVYYKVKFENYKEENKKIVVIKKEGEWKVWWE